jgi:ADP-ribose pyrophosphatase YjhB (NUDIX family)
LANDLQPLKAISLAEALLGDLAKKKIALLGLSFKPGTDDIRGAVSIQIVENLLERKAEISVYDPAAMKNIRSRFGSKLAYCHSALECIDDADCAIIVTEWPEFSKLKPDDFALRMRTPVLLDGRRCYSPNEFSEKIKYAAVGLGSEKIHLEPDETVWVNPACAVNVVVEDMRKILLVKRALEPFKDLWSLPGGYVEYGETTEDAAKREVKEECGLDARLQRVVGVYSDSRRHPWKHVIAICYAAEKVGGVIKPELGGVRAKFFTKGGLPNKLAFDHMKMIEDYLNGGHSLQQRSIH